MRAGDIAEQFDTTRPAISEHLRILVEARLLDQRREGTRRFYSVRREGFTELRAFLDQFWDDRLARLKAVVEQETHGTIRRKR